VRFRAHCLDGGVRTGHKGGKAPVAQLQYAITLDKTYDLRNAVGDMRRAVNYMRESKKQQEMLQGLDGKKNNEGKSWDRHTNKPRWNHTATDLLHQEFQNAVVVVKHETTGGVGGHESAGAHQSAGGVGGFGAASGGKAARTIKMMHDRHMQAEHRKRYDLWGVQGFLKQDREGFLEQAALVSKVKTEGSIDDQFRDAIFLKVSVHGCTLCVAY